MAVFTPPRFQAPHTTDFEISCNQNKHYLDGSYNPNPDSIKTSLSYPSPLSKGRELGVESPGDVEGDGAVSDVLEHGDGLAVGHPLEHLAVDGEDLIT